ncbi:MAG: DUF1080 domain-containing protein [Lentisphaeraceae bacterium]|nr:DUF1080 domain-containing protein [Lentisphaeraceae bacterium]
MKLFSVFLLIVFLASCKSTDQNSLFNGKDLTGWKVSQFGGEGEVEVKDGSVFLNYGNPITGITYTGEVPKVNFEVELEAQKVDGNDFFVGLTVPYQDTHMSLILGGWGGVVCGISSFDYADASENDTSFVRTFEKKKWYKIKLQVMESRVRAFIDGKQVIDKEIDGNKIHTRPEIDPSKPFGIAAFETQVMYRNITLRKIENIPLDY